MSYIKRDLQIYKIVEHEVSVKDLEFHITQLQEQIVNLNTEIIKMKKL